MGPPSWLKDRFKIVRLGIPASRKVSGFQEDFRRMCRASQVVCGHIYPFSGKLAETVVDSLVSLLMNDLEVRSGVTAYEIRQAPLAGWELAERARIVLWARETYVNDSSRRISKFWHDSFGAAFEELESEDKAVKNAALEEIAKLTVNVFDLDEDFEKPVCGMDLGPYLTYMSSEECQLPSCML